MTGAANALSGTVVGRQRKRDQHDVTKELEQDAAVVAPAHFPGLSLGRLLSRNGGDRDFTYLGS
jgi:hypothetical protein